MAPPQAPARSTASFPCGDRAVSTKQTEHRRHGDRTDQTVDKTQRRSLAAKILNLENPTRGPRLEKTPRSGHRSPRLGRPAASAPSPQHLRLRSIIGTATVILRFVGQQTDSVFDAALRFFPIMPRMPKPDPELLPIHRPRCPHCQIRMITADVSSGPEGFEHRTFECSRCGHTETRVVASEHLQTDAVGWTSGNLRRPPEEHHVFDTAQRTISTSNASSSFAWLEKSKTRSPSSILKPRR